MEEKSVGVYVLYGSQTGQAQSIAEGLHEEAIFDGIECKVFCLKDEGELFDIRQIKLAVFICSTTGDGDPPENARSFIDKLNRLAPDENALQHLHFTLLGLGNSDYSTFCGGPKKLLAALTRHQAKPFYEPIRFADDATDGEDTIEDWIDDLWDHVKKEKGVMQAEAAASIIEEEMKAMKIGPPSTLATYPDKSLHRNSDLSDVKLTLPPLLYTYIRLSPTEGGDDGSSVDDADVITAIVTSSERMTCESSDKVTMEMELQVDEDVEYEPGDSFAFECPNSQEEVDFILSRIQPTHTDDIDVPQTINIVAGFEGKPAPRHLPPSNLLITSTLTWVADIRAVCKKSLIRALADVTSHGEEQRRLLELCSRQGASDYTKHVRLPQLNIMDLLHNFPSCRPSIELVLQHLPALRHRPYSVACSPRRHSRHLRFAYTVVNTLKGDTTRRKDKKGLATGYLETCPLQTELKIRHRASTFRLPDDPKVPVILIGPGTGVAPFIGFLEHGHAEEAHLYFGCRAPEEDYIYKDKLAAFVASGALTSLNVAFSRVEPHGRYVQDVLREQGRLVVDVLERGGVVYVCGDARGMSRDVRSCFVDIFVAEVEGCDEDGGKARLKELVDGKRYKEDVWA